MKFRMLVKNVDSEWWETYTEYNGDADEVAKNLVDSFNATLRKGERPRTLLKVEKLDKRVKIKKGSALTEVCNLYRSDLDVE